LFHGFPIPGRQQIDWFTTLMVNNEGAIGSPFTKGPIINPNDSGGFEHGAFQPMKQPQ
jgi:hypothetical protein